MTYYRDLREHIQALESKDKLVRIRREINKDTELMPLVRWQFRGLAEEDRKAFLFEKVVSASGQRFNIPVLGASPPPPRAVSPPGFDNAPYISAGNWVTKDPETGIRNIGNYRGMIKSPARTGVMNHPGQHLRMHWEKCRQRGQPLQAAIVIGA